MNVTKAQAAAHLEAAGWTEPNVRRFLNDLFGDALSLDPESVWDCFAHQFYYHKLRPETFPEGWGQAAGRAER